MDSVVRGLGVFGSGFGGLDSALRGLGSGLRGLGSGMTFKCLCVQAQMMCANLI
jgi:hypothetical protein